MQPAPAYFHQQQLDGQFAVYSADGSLVMADIETLGDARNHILDLIAEAQEEAAALDDHHAEADAMAFSLAALVGRAA